MAAVIEKSSQKKQDIGIDLVILRAPSMSVKTELVANVATQENRFESYSKLLKELRVRFDSVDQSNGDNTRLELDSIGNRMKHISKYGRPTTKNMNIVRRKFLSTKLVTNSEIEGLDEKSSVNNLDLEAGIGWGDIWLAGYSDSHSTMMANTIYEFVQKVSFDPESQKRLENEPPKLIFHGAENSLDKAKMELRDAMALVNEKLKSESPCCSAIMDRLNEAAKDGNLITFVRNPIAASLSFGLGIVDTSSNSDKPRSVVLVAVDEMQYYSESSKSPVRSTAGALLWLTTNPGLAVLDREKVELKSEGKTNYDMSSAELIKLARDLRLIQLARIMKDSNRKGQELIVFYGGGSNQMLVFDQSKNFDTAVGINNRNWNAKKLSLQGPKYDLGRAGQYRELNGLMYREIPMKEDCLSEDRRFGGMHAYSDVGFRVIKRAQDGSIEKATYAICDDEAKGMSYYPIELRK